MAFLLSLEGDPASRFAHPHGSLFRARPPVLVHGARPSRDQVHSSGPWDVPSREWFAMPVSSRAAVASVLVVPHASHRLWVPARLRSGRGSDAAVQARLDRGPHGIPRGCQLSSQSSNGGSPDAQLSDRPTDRPHTQTRPGSTHRVVMLQERHRLAGSFTAHPTPYYATGSAQRPRLRARRSPPPPYDRDREQVTPQPGQPTSWLHDSTSSTRASGVRATPIRWKPSKPTSRSHRSQRPSHTEQQQAG